MDKGAGSAKQILPLARRPKLDRASLGAGVSVLILSLMLAKMACHGASRALRTDWTRYSITASLDGMN